MRPDPRVKLGDDAYAQQAALAQKIEALRIRVAMASRDAGKVLEDLAERRKGADAALARDIDALSTRVQAVLGGKPAANPHNSWSYPPQRVQTLRYVGEALDTLNHAVDGADAAPSPDAQAGFAKLQPLTESAVAAWQTLQSADVAALNARLKKSGAEPLESKPE